MLRVFKVTSPMSVGTWVLSASGASDAVAAVCEVAGVAPRLRLAAETTSAVLAPVLCTYTAVLVGDTAVPVWHEARRELPFVFAGGAAMSAGAAAALVTRHADARAHVACWDWASRPSSQRPRSWIAGSGLWVSRTAKARPGGTCVRRRR